MTGMLLQGPAEAFSLPATSRGTRALRARLETVLAASAPPAGPGNEQAPSRLEHLALIRLRPRRVVWWQGWSSGTVTDL